jgi:ribosomal protein S20
MSKLRLAGMASALVVAALVGGTLINVVAAAPGGPASPADSVAAAPADPAADPVAAAPAAAGTYCEAFRTAFAANLGVSQDELAAAAKAAAATAVDKAIADGTLTQAAGDRLKERIAAAAGDGCGFLAGPRGKIAKQALNVARDGVTAAAEALDMTVAELRTEFRAGKDLKEVAAAEGVPYATVTTAVLNAVKADLDAAVASGTIQQARADRILDRIEQRLEDGWVRAGQGGRQGR